MRSHLAIQNNETTEIGWKSESTWTTQANDNKTESAFCPQLAPRWLGADLGVWSCTVNFQPYTEILNHLLLKCLNSEKYLHQEPGRTAVCRFNVYTHTHYEWKVIPCPCQYLARRKRFVAICALCCCAGRRWLTVYNLLTFYCFNQFMFVVIIS